MIGNNKKGQEDFMESKYNLAQFMSKDGKMRFNFFKCKIYSALHI